MSSSQGFRLFPLTFLLLFFYNLPYVDNTVLRFALVGCGTIAPTHAQALAALRDEGACLSACCDSVPERAAAFAAQFGLEARSFEAILADPAINALTICVPSGLHAELGERALRAGKHVVVEKPMDITLAACDRLIAAQKASGKSLDGDLAASI